MLEPRLRNLRPRKRSMMYNCKLNKSISTHTKARVLKVWWYPLPDWDLKGNWLPDRVATWGQLCQTSPGGQERSRQGWQPWHILLSNSRGGIASLPRETNGNDQTALHIPDRPPAFRWEDLMKAPSKVSRLFHPQSFSKNTCGTKLSLKSKVPVTHHGR